MWTVNTIQHTFSSHLDRKGEQNCRKNYKKIINDGCYHTIPASWDQIKTKAGLGNWVFHFCSFDSRNSVFFKKPRVPFDSVCEMFSFIWKIRVVISERLAGFFYTTFIFYFNFRLWDDVRTGKLLQCGIVRTAKQQFKFLSDFLFLIDKLCFIVKVLHTNDSWTSGIP